MNVGDYVRTNDRGIRRIRKIIDDIFYKDEKDNLHQKGNLIKSSSNIIDLIEVGDIIHYEFYGIDDICVVIEENNLLGVGWDENRDFISLKDVDIKSIVTKEQFEYMEYKIGE